MRQHPVDTIKGIRKKLFAVLLVSLAACGSNPPVRWAEQSWPQPLGQPPQAPADIGTTPLGSYTPSNIYPQIGKTGTGSKSVMPPNNETHMKSGGGGGGGG